MNKGLLVFIQGMDCTNDGVTSGRKQAVLIGPGIPEVFEPSDEHPALYIRFEFNPYGAAPGYKMVANYAWASEVLGRFVDPNENLVVRILAEPGDVGGRWNMFGGQYVSTSDSRFPVCGPIPVFDRFEEYPHV